MTKPYTAEEAKFQFGHKPPSVWAGRVIATAKALEKTKAELATMREALELMTPAPGFPKCDSRCSSNSHSYDEDNRCDCGMEQIRMDALVARTVLESIK